MFKQFLNKKLVKNEKGLTLIELLAVIVILAIVAAIAIPAIGNIIDNSRGKALKSDVVNVMNAASLYFTDYPDEASVDLDVLGTSGYLESPGKLATATVTKEQDGNTVEAGGENGGITITVAAGSKLTNVNNHSGKPVSKAVNISSTTAANDEG